MIRSISDLLGCEIVGEDGEVGQIRDLFIDDETFKIRFVIAGRGHSRFEDSVMIPFAALGDVNWDSRRVTLPLTTSRVLEHKMFESTRTPVRGRTTG